MRSGRVIALIALLALVVMSSTGCGLLVKNAVENATGVHVNENGNSVTVTGKNGTASLSSQEGKLPDGLPSDVPAYSGTIKSSATIAADQGTNYTFAIETGDDVSTVQSWYKDKLTSNGWTVTGTVNGGGESAMVSAKKNGEKDNIVVTIGKDSSTSKTTIAVIVDIKK